MKTGHFYFAENRTFLFCLDTVKKMLDNHFKVRYKLIKKSEIQESGGLAPHILSISCKVVDVGCRCKKS